MELTNIKSFLEYLFYFNDLNSSDYFNTLRDTINEINKKIEENEKMNENVQIKENDEKIELFNNLILKEIKLFKNPLNHDPRLLIDYIFNLFLNVNSKNEQESISNILSPEFVNKSINESYTLLNNATIIGNNQEKNEKIEKINYVIKKEITCPDLNCCFISEFNKSFPTLHLYLKDNSEKEYTINECINNYFEKENEESEYMCSKCSKIFKNKSKSFFTKLPETLFIFIYYSNDFNNKKYYYNFEEILDITNNKFIDKKIKYKKYFISSIIACKFPKTEKEFFYTFCRKENNSEFLIYYSEEKKVKKHGKNIERQIRRLKNQDYDEEQSFPYVLIYTAL